jgi:methionyl-tRNA formyltransferase
VRVAFWGTPEFATPPLRALLGEGHEVVAVVTQPDRPQGRSRSTLVPSPVKQVALEQGIPVFQPEKPRGEEFLAALHATEPDLSVVVAYGRLLPQAAIDLPPRGTINIHGSLLPKLRGASPIEGAILAGMTETGVTIMRMVLALDAGPMLHVRRTPILPDETAGELRERLSELGAIALIEALALMEAGALPETPQDDAQATFCGLISRDQARVDWTQPAERVANAIRAYDPKPGAWATKDGAEVKLYGGRVVVPSAARDPHVQALRSAQGDNRPGTVLSIDANGMTVACAPGTVTIAAVHPAGRKRLSARDWAAGRGVAPGDVLG